MLSACDCFQEERTIRSFAGAQDDKGIRKGHVTMRLWLICGFYTDFSHK